MVSRRPIPIPRWMCWLVLCITTHLHLARAQNQDGVSRLFVPDSNTTIAINLPPNSDDINFYIAGPHWYQYIAIGFGSSMADALMLVMYSSADDKGVTVSPRLSTGQTEPVWTPSIKVTLHEGSTITDNDDMVANGTCHGCRALGPRQPSGETGNMMFAVGPSLALNSNDLDARIRRHIGYGLFTLSPSHATSPLGIPPSSISALAYNLTTPDIVLPPGSPHRDSGTRLARTHGILYAVTALAVAPFDSLIAAIFLGSRRVKARARKGGWERWGSWLHGVTGAGYFAFVVGGLVPGVIVGREHVNTQNFRTAHQVLGLLTVGAMGGMFFWGIALTLIKRSAEKRGQEPPESSKLLGTIHRWTGRVIWVLLLINMGLGLKLSEEGKIFILGYAVLAGALVVIMVPIYFCVWWCLKRRKDKEEDAHELNIYNHDYNHGYNQGYQ